MTDLTHIATLKRGHLIAAEYGPRSAAAFLRLHDVPFVVAYSVLRPFMSRENMRRLAERNGVTYE